MSNTIVIIVIVVAIVVLAAIAVVGYRLAQQKRTTRLREQYGPEYDHALDRADGQREAESELRGRSKRHEKLELRSLDSSEREDFKRRWSDVQGQFVDDPSNAVRNADQLVVEVMSARGYPVDDFDQRADDLSVSHPEVTQRYREARRIAQANNDGTVDTEDLRQAVTSYRSLVSALLVDDEDRSLHNGTEGEHDNTQITERETKAGARKRQPRTAERRALPKKETTPAARPNGWAAPSRMSKARTPLEGPRPAMLVKPTPAPTRTGRASTRPAWPRPLLIVKATPA